MPAKYCLTFYCMENLQILDLQLWKAMCTSKRTQRPLRDVMGSRSPFISTKMLVICLHVDCPWTKIVT